MRALVGFGFLLLAACSSKSSAAPHTDPVEIPIGGACDPAAANTCVQPNDACSIAICNPTTKVCAQRQSPEAGPSCGVAVTCASTSQCPSGFVCGYPIAGGCGATGTCVEPVACGTSTTLCGCDGHPVDCVSFDYAVAPVSGNLCAADASTD